MEEKMLAVFAWLLARMEHNNNFPFVGGLTRTKNMNLENIKL